MLEAVKACWWEIGGLRDTAEERGTNANLLRRWEPTRYGNR